MDKVLRIPREGAVLGLSAALCTFTLPQRKSRAKMLMVLETAGKSPAQGTGALEAD